MATTVVNIFHDPYDVYIGRAGHGQNGYFGNPAKIKEVCPFCFKRHLIGGETIECYKQYFFDRLKEDHEFRARVEELRGTALGCFCRPRGGFNGFVICHGMIIAAYLDGIEPKDVA